MVGLFIVYANLLCASPVHYQYSTGKEITHRDIPVNSKRKRKRKKGKQTGSPVWPRVGRKVTLIKMIKSNLISVYDFIISIYSEQYNVVTESCCLE